MSLQFHDVARGLKLDSSVTLIATAGPPSGGDADVVEIGSVALDFVNGHMYQKNTAGAGLDKWQFIGADKSFREPAEVRDNVSAVLPTGTPLSPIVIDGESITQDERVLFTLIATPNVYIYDQVTGVFIEDTNEATSGDTVYISTGTDAGKSFTFNGTSWVLTNQAAVDEIGFIQAYIGKPSDGSVLPIYSSTFTVATSDSLLVAIGKIDAAFGPSDQVSVSGVGTLTLDSVLVDDFGVVKWMVIARQGVNIVAEEVFATHDGTTGADAVNADFTRFAHLERGTIAGQAITVDLSGVTVAQVMRLQVTATGATDWRAYRLATEF